jgi:hypothetical protein
VQCLHDRIVMLDRLFGGYDRLEKEIHRTAEDVRQQAKNYDRWFDLLAARPVLAEADLEEQDKPTNYHKYTVYLRQFTSNHDHLLTFTALECLQWRHRAPPLTRFSKPARLCIPSWPLLKYLGPVSLTEAQPWVGIFAVILQLYIALRNKYRIAFYERIFATHF